MPTLTWKRDRYLELPARSYDLYVDGAMVRGVEAIPTYYIIKTDGRWEAEGGKTLGAELSKKTAKALVEEEWRRANPEEEAEPTPTVLTPTTLGEVRDICSDEMAGAPRPTPADELARAATRGSQEWAHFTYQDNPLTVRKCEVALVDYVMGSVLITLRGGRTNLVDGPFNEVCAKLGILLP